MIRQPLPDFAGLLQGDCADEVLRLLLFAMNELARSTGAQPSPKAVRLLHMLHKAAQQRHENPYAPGPDNHEQPSRETLTVRETAERMGCSTQWVRHLLNTGRLTGRKSGRVWIVHVDPSLALTQAP